MAEVRKTLRLFFAREFERGERIAAFFRRWKRRGLARAGEDARAPPRWTLRERRTSECPDTGSLWRRRRSWRLSGTASPRTTPPPDIAEGGHKAMARGARRRQVREVLTAVEFICLSVLLHGLLFWILMHVWIASTETPAGETQNDVVSFRLTLPRPKPLPPSGPPPPAPPEILVEPLPVPAETWGNTLERVNEESGGQPDGDGKPSGGLPDGDPSAKAREFLAPLLPLPIGVGAGAKGGAGSGVRRGYGGRGEGRGAALLRYGGTPQTEGAVALGLLWLLEHQDNDGGWSVEGFQRHCRRQVACPGRGLSEFDVGATGLAVLAFLGAGYLPVAPEGPGGSPKSTASTGATLPLQAGSAHRRAAKDALDYLIRRQDSSGAYGAVGENYFYNHAIAMLAVSEAFALTGMETYRQSLEAAVQFSVLGQQDGGGWDYSRKPSGRNDLSITGWQIMALRSAMDAGISVPEGTIEGVRRFLQVAVTPSGEGIYANLGQERGRRGINMVAVGLLSKLYLGASPQEPAVRAAVGRLLHTPPDPGAMESWDTTFQSYYYWYTATLALFHYGGEEWKAWNVFLIRRLLPLQSRKPHEEGSWPPELNWVGVSGGRVYATAINVLTLETYYRYEPLCKPRKS